MEINGFNLELDRDFKMFEPEKDFSHESSVLPDDFFELTTAEIKKQQQLKFVYLHVTHSYIC